MATNEQGNTAPSTESNSQDQADLTAQNIAFQNCVFHIKHDRTFLSTIVSTEPLPFKRSVIGYIFGFFAVYLLIIGICGFGLSFKYHNTYDNYTKFMNDTCINNQGNWTQVFSSLVDKEHCNDGKFGSVKCIKYDELMDEQKYKWTEPSTCDENGKKYRVRKIEESIYVLEIPSRSDITLEGYLYKEESC